MFPVKRSSLLTLLLVAGTVTACGVEGGREFLSLGTAGTGGIYYPLGGAIASRLSIADSARQFTAEVSGGSVENINRLASGQMDLAFVLAVTAFQGQRGEGDFVEPISDLRILAPLYPNLTHVLVTGNSEAQSISDFGGFRVSVGSAGSGTEQMSRHLLQAHGLTYDDIRPQYLSFAESSTALRDGAIDAAIISVGYPAAAVLEATTTGNVRLIPITAERIAVLQETHPYYTTGEIPAGSYPGVEEPIPTAAVINWIVALESLNGDVVRALLKLLSDDRATLEQVHDMAKQIDLERLGDPPIPLHSATVGWLESR
jgi:uncharacterized protein